MKIAVALSGGVDSMQAARLLQQDGHTVVGLTAKLCPDERDVGIPCPNGACTCVRAQEAARELGIALEMVEARERFEAAVITPFLDEWEAGRTPNPCAWCNREIKFGLLLEAAAALGAEGLATGHYAGVCEDQDGLGVMRGQDARKDQSYFLAWVPAGRFRTVHFPLHRQQKVRVAASAARWSRLAPRPASTEICFLHDRPYEMFVRRRRPEAFRPGAMVDLDGRQVGEHRGLPAYTVGQRRGLGVAAGQRQYVVALDATHNRVVFGPERALWRRHVQLDQMNWLNRPGAAYMDVHAQIRYRQTAVEARVWPHADHRASLTFAEPVRAVTPGQVAALYRGDRLLGGGRIVSTGDSA